MTDWPPHVPDERKLWWTMRVEGEPGFRRGYESKEHPTREAAWAYADRHGHVVTWSERLTAG